MCSTCWNAFYAQSTCTRENLMTITNNAIKVATFYRKYFIFLFYFNSSTILIPLQGQGEYPKPFFYECTLKVNIG